MNHFGNTFVRHQLGDDEEFPDDEDIDEDDWEEDDEGDDGEDDEEETETWQVKYLGA